MMDHTNMVASSVLVSKRGMLNIAFCWHIVFRHHNVDDPDSCILDHTITSCVDGWSSWGWRVLRLLNWGLSVLGPMYLRSFAMLSFPSSCSSSLQLA